MCVIITPRHLALSQAFFFFVELRTLNRNVAFLAIISSRVEPGLQSMRGAVARQLSLPILLRGSRRVTGGAKDLTGSCTVRGALAQLHADDETYEVRRFYSSSPQTAISSLRPPSEPFLLCENWLVERTYEKRSSPSMQYARFDAGRRGKKLLNSSRDKFEGPYLSGEGEGVPARAM